MIDFQLVRRAVVMALVALVALVFLLDGWFTVDAGERAVVLRLGAISWVADEGFHIKAPMIDRPTRIEIRVRKATAESGASSKDLQIVHTEIALNYSVNPSAVADVYRQLGRDWEHRVVEPALHETFKAVTAHYTAEDLIAKRAQVSEGITTELRNRLSVYGLKIESVSLTDFDFSDEFNRAIEAKVTAEQNALKARRDLERIQTEAEQRVAQAEGEARALRSQRAEITPELLKLKEIENQRIALEKWNGQLPQYVGATPIPFISVK